jgi:hypothetical protein
MIEAWNRWLIEAGFDGMYLIETLNSYQINPVTSYSQGAIEFEPLYTFQHELTTFHKIKLLMNKITESLFDLTVFVIRFSYEEVWNRILKRKINRAKNTFLCGFVDWDNSPRK